MDVNVSALSQIPPNSSIAQVSEVWVEEHEQHAILFLQAQANYDAQPVKRYFQMDCQVAVDLAKLILRTFDPTVQDEILASLRRIEEKG